MLSQSSYKSFVPLPDSHFFQDQPFLLEQLWEGVSYGMFLMEVLEGGEEFRYVAFNPAMEQISPIPTDHLLGKTLAEAFPAEMAQIYRQHYRVAATTDQALSVEEVFDQGGRKVSWLLTINPLHNPTITHILVTITDISPNPKPQTDHSRRLLQQILDEIPIAIFWKDRNFVFQGCNRTALVACGLKSTDLMIGKTDYDMPWTAEESDWYRLCDRRVMESGQAEFNIVETQRQADGTQVILNTNKVPLRDETGRVTGILVTIEDITARQATEAALHSFADQQALINRITAQIRNTLNVTTILKTTIKALSELLEVDWCAFSWYGLMEPAVWQVLEDQSWDGQSWVGQYRASEINEAILRLETQRLDRIDAKSKLGYPDFLRTSGARSRLCVPLKTQRDQFGVILCDRQTQHHWTDDEVVLVQSVADQLAIAIDQAELYDDSRAKGKALQHTLQELKRAQAQMVQNEKMSSLGQLVAGIAHEINNPVNFIHGNVDYTRVYVADLLKLVEQYQQCYPEPVAEINQAMEAIDLDFLRRDFPKILDSMQLGTARINEIVESLRSFSRLDETGLKVVDLHKGIDSALMILQSRINHPPAIEIVKDYSQLPLVECLAGEINQVFMNILVNAIDALNELGSDVARQIVITTEAIGWDQVAIRIANNGPAIPIDIQHRIFDPFFTTKPVGQGTGMGMAISYQIITDKHHGQLLCHSQRGQGTEFVIQLPIAATPKETSCVQTDR
jgi:two-component system, NtrC family, sensor kinase